MHLQKPLHLGVVSAGFKAAGQDEQVVVAVGACWQLLHVLHQGGQGTACISTSRAVWADVPAVS